MKFEVVKDFLDDIGAEWAEVDDEVHLDADVFYQVWKYLGQPDLKTCVREEEVVEPGSYDPPEKKYVKTKKIKIKKIYFETLDGKKIVTDYSDFQKLISH